MKLRVLVPEEVAVKQSVVKVVAEAENGSFCLLPRHVDFVAALVPGLLSYEDRDGNEEFLAVDQGLLVKCGDEVLVSTARVIRDRPLGELQRAVEEELRSLDEHQRRARVALGKIEASFVGRLVELERRFHG
jgi:F-type H+-transporting ATPase subunit epsilon